MTPAPTLAPAPVPRRRIPAASPETYNKEEDGTRAQRKEQAAFRAKFGITDPELPDTAGVISMHSILEEMTGGRSEEWFDKEEIHLKGCLDWLLKDDKEVVEMLRYERLLIKHHHCNKPRASPISLAHQAARQDPGIYLTVMAGLQNLRVVSVPFRDEGSLFVELDLDDPAGSMHLACQPSAPTGSDRRLSLAWAGVSEDGEDIEGPTKSWDKYVVGHARAGLGGLASIVRLPSTGVLGSAMLCQVSFLSPAVCRAVAVVAGKDRALARDFIQRTRADILCRLKIAFRELIMVGQFAYQGDAYYANLGATQASDNTTTTNDDSDLEATKRKRQRTGNW